MQGPEAFLARLGIELSCPVSPGEPAALRPELRTTVNGHFFWVSSAERLEPFRREPARFTGPLLDPATHAWFTPTMDSPRLDREGEILLFEEPASRDAFLAAPTPADRHGHAERVPGGVGWESRGEAGALAGR